MTGIELILSSIYNITAFQSSHILPSIGSSSANQESEKKALREMINGMHLRIGTLQDGPMSGVIISEDGNTIGIGVSFIILNFLSDKFNFTYDIVMPPSIIVGKHRKGRSEFWLLKMLMNHKIDMIGAFMSITPELQDVVNFSLETDTVNCLFINNMSYSSNTPMQLLQPFHASVWICFMWTLICYVACLILLTRVRSALFNDNEAYFTLSSSLSYVYRACTNQDVPQSPNSSMTRILLMTWSIFIILVSTYYAGHLSKGFTLTSIAGENFIASELSLFDASGVSLNYKDVEGCYEMVSLNRYTRRPSGFAYPKNSSLNILFDTEIRRLYNAGLLHLFYKEYESVKNKVCPVVMHFSTRQLGLRDLSVCYYCWIIGGVAGLGVFLLELLVYRLGSLKSDMATQIHPEKTNKNRSFDNEKFSGPRHLHSFPHHQSSPFQRRIVNGRQYLEARTKEGLPRLVPVDSLSTFLFDTDSYEA